MLKSIASCCTIEEIALALQDLADLQHPDLSDSRVAWVQNKGLFTAIGHSGGQCEFKWVSIHTILKPQTAHLHTYKQCFDLLYTILDLSPNLAR